MRKDKILGNMRELSKWISGGRIFQTEVRARTKALRQEKQGVFEKQLGVWPK